MSPAIVECRLPACRRPALLRRALDSLQAQTDPDWRAVVLDDSPAGEAAAVVADCADPRISYRQHPQPLGATGNLDAAFTSSPMLNGTYAFVLEDDNAIAPDFIALGRARLARGDADIVSFNQVCIRLEADGREIREGTLRSDQAEILWPPDRILLHAFLGRSLPNGGYFWRLGVPGLDLVVGPDAREPQLQECIRQTRIFRALPLLPQPASRWSLLPSTDVRRQVVTNRRLAANLAQVGRAIHLRLGRARLTKLAGQCLAADEQHRVMADLTAGALLPPRLPDRALQHPVQALRGLARHLLYTDDIGRALSHLALPARDETTP